MIISKTEEEARLDAIQIVSNISDYFYGVIIYYDGERKKWITEELSKEKVDFIRRRLKK